MKDRRTVPMKDYTQLVDKLKALLEEWTSDNPHYYKCAEDLREVLGIEELQPDDSN